MPGLLVQKVVDIVGYCLEKLLCINCGAVQRELVKGPAFIKLIKKPDGSRTDSIKVTSADKKIHVGVLALSEDVLRLSHGF